MAGCIMTRDAATGRRPNPGAFRPLFGFAVVVMGLFLSLAGGALALALFFAPEPVIVLAGLVLLAGGVFLTWFGHRLGSREGGRGPAEGADASISFAKGHLVFALKVAAVVCFAASVAFFMFSVIFAILFFQAPLSFMLISLASMQFGGGVAALTAGIAGWRKANFVNARPTPSEARSSAPPCALPGRE